MRIISVVIFVPLMATLAPISAQQAKPAQQAPPAPLATQAPPTPQSPQPQTSPEEAEVKVHENVVYGTVNGNDLLLDIYEPSDASPHPRAAVLMIHGGSWNSLDKSTLRNMGRFLARAGFVAFSANYRLLQGTDNRWPAQLDDMQRAVRWIRANAAKYNIDPEHVGSWGHSAGAQLAALLGMEDTRDNSDAALAKFSSRVQAVVDVSGPADFTTNRTADGEAFLANFLGLDYAKGSDVWRDASPAFHAAKGDAPFLIVHGTKDEDVPVAQAQELYDKLIAAGASAKLVTLDDVHTFRTPEARARLAFETLQFYKHYLAGSASE